MIYAMVAGTLTGDAEAKRSANGNEYSLLVLRIPGEPAQFVRVSIFGDDAEDALFLHKGDAVTVTGALSISVWEQKGKAGPALSMMANRCVSPAIRKPRKRQKKTVDKASPALFKAAAEIQSIRVENDSGLADDLPWR